VYRGVRYRLGSSSFVFGEARRSDAALCLFTADGKVQACYQLEEDLRRSATAEVEALQRKGYEVHVLSGDRAQLVGRAAARLGVLPGNAHGGLSPQAKADFVHALDRADTMMIGDGLNDALAFEAAYCTGTPAENAPVLPARSDFFFRGDRGAVSAVLDMSRRLRSVVVTNMVLASAYNGCTLLLCFAGRMSPLLCAVLMPLSSLALVGHTALRVRRPLGPSPEALT
jgi:Cu2+-exporting ATPase